MKKNNISLDIMMGLLCIVCVCTIIGLVVIDDVLYKWEMIKEVYSN